ncbi:metallo-beta-lactamase domain protein [delta proteobacterium NaphS2]|nr:metallo-beta-lactamase domain protein [delta proteobacterium NaphS2]
MSEIFIPIQQDLPGFNPFFGSWISQGDVTFLVDPGPANTADRLIDSMEAAGIKRLDYVLITHIHIDHGGALFEVLKRYPEASAICHEKGVPHLVDPSRLYEGSLNVLGDLARTYGSPKPVEKERLIPHTLCPVDGLEVIETPGHAIHHLSFTYEQRLYAGEAAGNYFIVDGQEYLRPATPARFFLNVFSESVDRLLSLEDQPIRYAHVESADKGHRLLRRFKDQLQLWESVIGECVGEGGRKADMIQHAVERLLKEDPRLAAFESMGENMRKRERTFMANSVNGFVGFFEERAREQRY